MKLQKEKVAEARELGRLAFHAGKICIPWLDADLRALLVGNQIGQGAPMCANWSEGCIRASLSQPVEGMVAG